jgi:hypothetical protein
MAKYSIVHSVRVCTEFVPETFGRLTTLGPAFLMPWGTTNKRNAYQVCLCVCGRATTHRVSQMKSGLIRSCGCLQREIAKICNTTHGLSTAPEYKAWADLLQRCDNPNEPAYEDYGLRGISYCGRWKKFENFFADMGQRPGPSYSIERDDVNGNYEPSNCRWATKKEQANNTRANRMITIGDKIDTLANWCRHFEVNYSTVKARLYKHGWDSIRALTTPIKTRS